jgi:hypothetical protein
MSTATRWIVVVVAALVIVGMLAYARGHKNHRGDDVGAITVATFTVTVTST